MLTKQKMFKAQITKQFIGIMVVIIIGVAVVIPVINSVIATANLTGTTKTLVDSVLNVQEPKTSSVVHRYRPDTCCRGIILIPQRYRTEGG